MSKRETASRWPLTWHTCERTFRNRAATITYLPDNSWWTAMVQCSATQIKWCCCASMIHVFSWEQFRLLMCHSQCNYLASFHNAIFFTIKIKKTCFRLEYRKLRHTCNKIYALNWIQSLCTYDFSKYKMKTLYIVPI